MKSQRRTKSQWKKVIEAYRASGLTAAEFCKKHEFSVHTLKNQIYKINKDATPTKQSNAFVELLPALPSKPRFITLSTSSGYTIQIPEGVDPRWLSSFLPAIGG